MGTRLEGSGGSLDGPEKPLDQAGAAVRRANMLHLHAWSWGMRENLQQERDRAVGHGGDSVTQPGWCAPRSPCTRLPGQPHACTPRYPRRALTHSGDLGQEQEKIISGVERQIQGKGLEELNRACASKGEC